MNTTAHGAPVAVEFRNGQEWVNSRDLHKALDSGYQYSDWIKARLEKFEFIEGEDYISVQKNLKRDIGATRVTDYLLTIDTAKELAMLENNEAGRKIRRYFIGVEKKARQLHVRMRELGIEQVEACALVGHIYNRFSTSADWNISKINRFLYLLSVNPPLAVTDIAKLMDISIDTANRWIRRLPRELVEEASSYLAPINDNKTIQLALPLEAEAAHA